MPSQLIVFPDEGHWILKPKSSQLWYKSFFGWLDRYLEQFSRRQYEVHACDFYCAGRSIVGPGAIARSGTHGGDPKNQGD
ncbi:MAG: prolyl oligopeptidase family serine peptidase [Candidatus Acidiferrales bacterium]